MFVRFTGQWFVWLPEWLGGLLVVCLSCFTACLTTPDEGFSNWGECKHVCKYASLSDSVSSLDMQGSYKYPYYIFRKKISLSFSDDDADWSPEDSTSAPIGARGPEAGPLLGVRRGCAASSDGHVRSHCPLAGLYMVRHWQHGEKHDEEWPTQDRLARATRRANETVL